MKKRHSQSGIDQGKAAAPHSVEGVGGRQATPPPPAWGGGYLDICGSQKIGAGEKKRDPRLGEFEAMGMPRVWMQVADAIGVDAFLAMWRILDADESLYDERMIITRLRPYRSYLRYQRNRYIETLTALGLSAEVVNDSVRRQLGENLTERHIHRLIQSYRMRK